MQGHGNHAQDAVGLGLLVAVGFAGVLYLGAVLAEKRRGKRAWPARRSVLWVLGLGVIATTLVGPLAEQAHTSFPAHMAVHLLVGMLAPLVLVLAAPVTLTLRTLRVAPARQVVRVLNSGPVQFLTHPIPASVANVGSLWVVYATPLGAVMSNTPSLHYFLLAHFLAAGYFFTASIIGVDPARHRAGFRLRMVVVLLAVAGHSVLAKYIYIYPPAGETVPDAQLGAVLMYYGGDLIELALIAVFFAQWYKDARPKVLLSCHGVGVAQPTAGR